MGKKMWLYTRQMRQTLIGVHLPFKPYSLGQYFPPQRWPWQNESKTCLYQWNEWKFIRKLNINTCTHFFVPSMNLVETSLGLNLIIPLHYLWKSNNFLSKLKACAAPAFVVPSLQGMQSPEAPRPYTGCHWACSRSRLRSSLIKWHH